MKTTRSSPNPRGVGGYSRQAAHFFTSREWLDRPLPVVTAAAKPPLAVRLGLLPTGALRKAVG